MAGLEQIPVLVGIGEALDRPDDLSCAKSPADLIVEAICSADDDAGGGWLSQVDRIDVAKCVSWGYRDLARTICDRLDIAPTKHFNGPGSGERPTVELFEAMAAVANGELRSAIVCGGEAQWSVDQARRTGAELPWQQVDWSTVIRRDPKATLHPLAYKYGLHDPVHVYPLFQVATAAHWGQTPEQAQREAAEVMAQLSVVAAGNPYAWFGSPAVSAEVIGTESRENRMICWPYLKMMVARPSVNLASAVIVTSLAEARRRGIADERLVYCRDSVYADEPRQYVDRDRYAGCASQEAVLTEAAVRAGAQLDAVELYSCFPIVPLLARHVLDLPDELPPTVTGGLAFFGGPMNNYMGHAIVAMTRKLRSGGASTGLLYGQGGFMTKHHALVLGSSPAAFSPLTRDVQEKADALRRPVPMMIDEYNGRATVETFTVIHDRSGQPTLGVIIALTDGGARLFAHVGAEQLDDLACLERPDVSPVGRSGNVHVDAGGMNRWSFA